MNDTGENPVRRGQWLISNETCNEIDLAASAAQCREFEGQFGWSSKADSSAFG